jgi:multifunctional methyltransferase subunit TRM112
MKLLTYNLLSSNVYGLGMHDFHLCLQATEINYVYIYPDFLAQMLPKMKWAVIVQGADTSILAEVLKDPTESYYQDETFFRKMYPHVA